MRHTGSRCTIWDLALQRTDSIVGCEVLVALQHVGALFPEQGLNLHSLNCKADS